MPRSAIALVFLLPLAGCGPHVVGSGRVVFDDRELSEDVRVINLTDVGDLTVEFGDAPGIEIETDDNIIPLVVTSESGDVLTIRIRGSVSPSAGIKYRVTVKALDELSLSGAGNATVSHWAGSDVKVKISGAGDLTATEIAVNSFSCKLSGAGNMTVTGVTNKADLRISGAGKVAADGLRAAEVKADVSGAGSAQVWAEKDLRATISGAGSISYLGNPHVHSSVSGAGTIQPAR
ncbi:MAG TPA: head GIN domain-containing protein [Fimbriiglobus sp.]|jgi:hypothetical protein